MLGFILAQVIKIVLTIAVPTLSYMGTMYLKRRWDIHLSQEENQMVMNLAKNAVMASEQQFRNNSEIEDKSKLKQKAAIEHIRNNTSRRGVQLDEDLILVFVEAAVHEIFNQKSTHDT